MPHKTIAGPKSASKPASAIKAAKVASPASKRTRLSSKHQDISFETQMEHVREELPVPQQVFSKIIHYKPIEATSDFLGATIFRPNALLAGSVAAFLLMTATYVLTKQLGYPLSGFETIATFVIGWALGMLYDYLSVLLRGDKHH